MTILMPRDGIKASVFLAMRNDLINAVREIDAEIDKALKSGKSKRAFEHAKHLFAERQRVSTELVEFGVEVPTHPAVWAHLGHPNDKDN